MACRNALRVLPLPVGATTSACLPSAMLDQAPSWAGVGPAKEASNQARVGALKRSRAVMLCSLSPTYDIGSALWAGGGPGRTEPDPVGGSDPGVRAAAGVASRGGRESAEAGRGLVLGLTAAQGLDELPDVVEPRHAAAVDGLVHLAEARGVGGGSIGGAGGPYQGESGDGSRGKNALHVTSLLL